ncbi:MAG TPA: hypothetical protein VIH82_08795 [Acidimicrobiia bacterium]|jgi:hypothetical protein
MASVHVHVGGTKHKAGPVKRTARWADRAVLGLVMGIAAFVIERAVIRGTKKKAPQASAPVG